MIDYEMKSIRIQGNPFARADFFATEVKSGSTRTPWNARICALTEDFLLGFRDAMIYECGMAYRAIMKSAGSRWGQRFVNQFDRFVSLQYQSPLQSLHRGVVMTLLQEAFVYHGWGKLTVDKTNDQGLLIVVRVQNSVMPDLIANSDHPVDLLMTGFLASVFSHITQTHWDALQTSCPSRGDSESVFVLMSPSHIRKIDSWISSGERLKHEEILERIYSSGLGSSHDTEIDMTA